MHIDRGGAATSGSPKKLFDGVRFVLFGFDYVSESQYRSELMNGGGIDVGRYDSSCTHVIVSGRVFDDPVCVLASNDGKILVTELWIDDSLNSGMLADSTKVLYRPVRDLNGIPGSESMHICLTGYQRQERDDIMKMVSLMGARFSKPLIANQVTHLICYKFEGEKYELAKKVNIKLVNHHWLEDCLKTWEILPIDKYTKSAWELEVLEAQAMDSEEENDGGGRKFAEQRSTAQNSNSRGEVPVEVVPGVLMHDNGDMDLLNSTVPTELPNLSTNNKLFSTPCGDSSSQKANDFGNNNSNLQGKTAGNVRDDHGIVGDIVRKQSSTSDYANVSSKYIGFPSDVSRTLFSTSSREEDKKLSLSCYSRKVPERVVSPEERSNNSLPYKEKMEENKANRNSDISSTKSNASAKLCISDDLCTPLSGTNTSNVEGRTCSLPQKRKLSVLSVDSKLLKQDQISRTSTLIDTPNIFAGKPNFMKPRGLTPDNMPFHNDASGSVCSVVEQSNEFRQKQKQCISSNCKESAGLALQTSSTCTKQNPSTNVVVPYKEPDAGFARTDNFEATTLGNLGANQHDAVSKRMTSSYKRKSIKDYSSPLLVKFSGEPTSASDHKDESSSNGFPPKSASDMKTSETSGEMAGVSNMYSMSSRDGKLPLDCPVINESGQVMNTSAGRHANFLRPSPASEVADGNEASNGMNFLQQQDLRETEAAVKFEGHNVVALRCKLDLHSETTAHHNRLHEDPEVLQSDLSGKKVKTCAQISGECKQQKSKEGSSHHKVPVSRKMGCRTKLSKKSNFSNESASNPHTTIQLSKVVTISGNNIVKEDLASNKKAEKCQPVNGTSYKVVEDENNLDPEKENKTKDACNLSPLLDKDCGKVIKDSFSLHDAKSSRGEAVNYFPRSSTSSGVIFDPVWFILSGPRVQRKEFQSIIRRLGGKVCRDSHHWSYQATHFIVCDPIRRTEKFFAAAASGRWILRSDYLTACSEAGKFLDEESFEWHRNGLTGDGAISLEAPRKWRTLREKTGHGAFYGMHIIIYGECIAPPLDTLKRVVKAGDGTILATSPPYTRFLNSGVDFAIVTTGMPRIDIWVQEFLRHEIPCVLADYLVEYVCKPGYSLEKHVLYKTHKWAEKSLANLLTRSKEVVLDDSPTSAGDSSDDLVCVVCGSLDRGEVMLICGDEGGTLGCGIGTHIDCCNPPLEAVPVDDWFCPSCSKTVGQKTTVTSTKTKSKKRK